MKETRYFYVPRAAEVSQLPAEETAHALRVLRLQAGDELFLIDGCGSFYRAEVTLATNHSCCYRIVETLPQEKTWHGRLHIAMAPTKMMERVEWMVEKATEVGVDEFSFLNCQFSERRQLRRDRVEKIVVSAVKQSRKAFMPVVNELLSFRDFMAQPRGGRKFIAHCYEEIAKKDLFEELSTAAPSLQAADEDVTVLIGPEGDFSVDEVREAMERGYESVSLGQSRLRTETAALSAVMMMQLSMRK